MTRRMSCSLTTDAVRARTKTETRRRLGTWRNLHAGDRLVLVEKAMGLPKGATQVILATVEIVDVADVPLFPLTHADVVAEGLAADEYPYGMTPEEFCRFWLESHGYKTHGRLTWQFEAETTLVRRIRWRYLDDEELAP